MKHQKALRLAVLSLGLLVIAAGIALWIAYKRSFPITAASLSMVGLAISLEYKDEKRRVPMRILQALAVLVILATPIGWLSLAPHWYAALLQIAALACNVPLAIMGFSKNES